MNLIFWNANTQSTAFGYGKDCALFTFIRWVQVEQHIINSNSTWNLTNEKWLLNQTAVMLLAWNNCNFNATEYFYTNKKGPIQLDLYFTTSYDRMYKNDYIKR